MKIRMFIICLILFQLTFSQQSDKLKKVLNGLTKLTKPEIAKSLKPSNNLKIYDTKGNQMNNLEANKLLVGKKHVADTYYNSKNEIVLLVVRLRKKEDSKIITTTKNEGSVPSNNDLLIKTGDKIPYFKLKDLNGKTFESKELKGKVIVLNFWYTNCLPCVKEIPELNKLTEKHKKNNVVFLAITFNKKEKIEKFLKKKKFTYKIIPNELDLIYELGIKGYPKNIVVGKDSKISKIVSGFNEKIYIDLNSEIIKQLKNK